MITPASETLIQRFFDASLDGLLVVDAVTEPPGGFCIDLRLVKLNTQAAQDLGGVAADLIGRSLNELIPEIGQALLTHCQTALETGSTTRFDVPLTMPGQPHRWYILQATPVGAEGLIITYQPGAAIHPAPLSQQQVANLTLSILDNSLSSVIVFEPVRAMSGQVTDFRVLYCNQAARQAFGYAIPLELGTLLTDLYPTTRQTGLFNRYVAVLTSGETLEGEHFYPDQEQWSQYSISRQDDTLIVTFRLVTETRRLQLEVKKQADLLRTVVTNQPTGIVLVEAVRDAQRQIIDLRYLLTNEVNAQLVGLPVEAMIGHTVLDLFPGYDTVELYQRLCQVIESGESQRYIFEYNLYGINAWFDATIVKQGDDGALLSFLDVTATKQAELKQQQQAELLDQVINTSLNALVVHRAIRNEAGVLVDFQVTLANEIGLEWMQVPAEAMYARPMSVHFPNYASSAIFRHYQQVIETGQPYQFERNFGGQWFDFIAARFGDGVVVSATNVTTLRQSQQQLEAINDELRRSNENLQQFAYVASHDLQEPLRKIQAFSGLLGEQFGEILGAEGAAMLHRMQTAANRMSDLIRDLLMYSRISSQKNPFRPVPLSQLLKTVIDDLEVLIQEGQARIELENLPVVTGDRGQLHQLFQNLLANALKFRKPDPETGLFLSPVISIASRPIPVYALPDSVRRLSAGTSQLFCEISISDNGVGFDEKYLDRIFQMFQRLHSKSNYAGTGVGLAICQRVAENHGGAITAVSQPGQGATFRVYLPVSDAPEKPEKKKRN